MTKPNTPHKPLGKIIDRPSDKSLEAVAVAKRKADIEAAYKAHNPSQKQYDRMVGQTKTNIVKGDRS